MHTAGITGVKRPAAGPAGAAQPQAASQLAKPAAAGKAPVAPAAAPQAAATTSPAGGVGSGAASTPPDPDDGVEAGQPVFADVSAAQGSHSRDGGGSGGSSDRGRTEPVAAAGRKRMSSDTDDGTDFLSPAPPSQRQLDIRAAQEKVAKAQAARAAKRARPPGAGESEGSAFRSHACVLADALPVVTCVWLILTAHFRACTVATPLQMM